MLCIYGHSEFVAHGNSTRRTFTNVYNASDHFLIYTHGRCFSLFHVATEISTNLLDKNKLAAIRLMPHGELIITIDICIVITIYYIYIYDHHRASADTV